MAHVPATQECLQLVEIRRFHHMRLESRVARGFSIFVPAMTRHCHEQEFGISLSQNACNFISADARKTDVHQRDLGMERFDCRDGFRPTVRNENFVAPVLREQLHRLDCVGVVVDDEYISAARRRCGRRATESVVRVLVCCFRTGRRTMNSVP